MKKPVVWVVERRYKGKWEPTWRMGVTRERGKEELELMTRLCGPAYRLRKYERVEK